MLGSAAHGKTSEFCPELILRPAPRVLHVAGWKIPVESTGEVETPLAEAIRDTTTSDGSAAAVLYGQEPPEWFTSRYGTDARRIRWSQVTDDDRARLLVDVNRAVERNAWYARRLSLWEGWDTFLPLAMPGLRVLRAEDPSHLSHWLGERLEYVLERTNPTWVEIHFRGPFAPSTTARALRTFFPAAPSLHVHAPVPVAFETLRQGGVRGAALRTDFFLRANAFAELATVIYRRRPIKVSPPNGPNAGSGPLCVDGIPDVAAQFFGEQPEHDIYQVWLTKNSFVGLRDDDLYDRSSLEKLVPDARPEAFRWFGLEFRFLRGGKQGRYGEFDDASWPTVLAFLDAARAQLESGAFGAMEKRIDRWWSSAWPRPVDRETLGRAMQGAWWRSPHEFQWLVDTVSHGKARRLREAFETGEEVAALVFDWTRFPLVAGDARLLRAIRTEQTRALNKMDSTQDLTGLVAEMLWRSGLFSALGASFGLEVPRPSWLPERATASRRTVRR